MRASGIIHINYSNNNYEPGLDLTGFKVQHACACHVSQVRSQTERAPSINEREVMAFSPHH